MELCGKRQATVTLTPLPPGHPLNRRLDGPTEPIWKFRKKQISTVPVETRNPTRNPSSSSQPAQCTYYAIPNPIFFQQTLVKSHKMRHIYYNVRTKISQHLSYKSRKCVIPVVCVKLGKGM